MGEPASLATSTAVVSPTLSALLTEHKQRRAIGDAKIATVASERVGIAGYVTRSTVRNWTTGVSASVNNWRQLALIASALQLTLVEADQLMEAGGCDRVTDLRRIAVHEDQMYLRFWVDWSPELPEPSAPPESASTEAMFHKATAQTGVDSLDTADMPEFASTGERHESWTDAAPAGANQPLRAPQLQHNQTARAAWSSLIFALLGGLIAVGLWLSIGGRISDAASASGNREPATSVPVTTVELPAPGSTINTTIIASGTASDAAGLEHVELVIKDLLESTYWNPVAGIWQDEFVRFVVPVETATETVVWNYRLPVPVPTGEYRVRAWARSTSGKGDPIGPLSDFNVVNNVALDIASGAAAAPEGPNKLVTLPEGDGFPISTLDSPAPAGTVGSHLVVTGTATDPNGIAYVELILRNLDTDEYWNPTVDQWQSDFTRFAIDVDNPGGTEVTWHFEHPEELIGGNYRSRVWAKGSNGDRDENRTLSDFTVE